MMTNKGGLLLLWASALCSLASGTRTVADGGEKGLTRGMKKSAAAAPAGARVLQDGDVCDEDTVFVDSLITDLGNPIGGCYQLSANSTLIGGFPFYALAGGSDIGDAWIYANGEGTWEIGLVEESSFSTVCTAEGYPAENFAVTDSQLDDAWECSYFMDGVTNRGSPDFTGVECGCDGRTTPTAEDDGGSGGTNTTAIAIAVLVALAVLALVVCGCFIRVKKKGSKAAEVEAPKEDLVVEE